MLDYQSVMNELCGILDDLKAIRARVIKIGDAVILEKSKENAEENREEISYSDRDLMKK